MFDFEKERKNTFQRFKRLPRAKSEKKAEFKFPSPRQADTRPDELDQLVRLLHDDALAKRVLALKREYPGGTIPELVVYDWLRARKWLKFDYQVSMFGGRRAAKGDGIVPDFVVFFDANYAMVWNVQGEYWHGIDSGQQRDVVARLRLLGAVVDGARIEAVVELWEDDIYNKRQQTFDMAVAGVGLRG